MSDSRFTVRGSVNQVSVTGPSGTLVELRSADGAVVAGGVVDAFGDRLTLDDLGVTDGLKGLGGLVLRDLAPGPYTVALDAETGSGDGSGERIETTVLDPRVLPVDFDDRVRGQVIGGGYGYVEVRDGALLGCNVFLPDSGAWGEGPYPTVVVYSGYIDTRPDFALGDPALDCHLNTEANVALLLGYAVVGVSLRGCGGSEGSFLLFEAIQGTDGYDVIEAIAAQPWVASKRDGSPKLGMLGRSMPGYTQLLTASFGPPSLAAITPAAVGGRPLGSAGRPGGIPNVSMARGIAGWQIDPIAPINGVPQQQPPRYAPGGWDDWVPALVAGGDEIAERNQLLRGQAMDAVPDWTTREHEEGGILVHADAEVWSQTVTVPTLLLGSWQDQLSGPWFVDLIDRFPPETLLRVFAYNGTHEETRFPLATAAWVTFLALFVREEAPAWNDAAQHYLDAVTGYLYAEGVPVSLGPYDAMGFAAARDACLASPRVVVAFDHGAAPDHPTGYPYAAFSVGFDGWPPGTVEPQRWYLAADHGLERDRPVPGAGEGDASPLSFRCDASGMPRTSAGDGFDVNAAAPNYDWRPPQEGCALQFATPPLEDDLLLVGTSSLDLWVSASVPDVDLEVVLSEVRPDGWETYVQAGWLRTSCRALDETRSTELHPRLSFTQADAAPLPAGEFALVRVPIGAAGHLFRSGSRVAITIGAAGGNQADWDLDPRHREGVDGQGRPVLVELGVDATRPSSMVIPVVGTWEPLAGAPERELPAPGALRRQPSRRWLPDGPPVTAMASPAPGVSDDTQPATPKEADPRPAKRSLAAGVGLAAVVGLLAAGVGLALVRLLRHKR